MKRQRNAPSPIYQARLQTQQQWVEQAQRSQEAPGVLLLLGHAGGSPLVGGVDTAADWLINRAGGRNLATHSGPTKALSSEALLALDPQVVVVADRALEGDAARRACCSRTRPWPAQGAALRGAFAGAGRPCWSAVLGRACRMGWRARHGLLSCQPTPDC